VQYEIIGVVGHVKHWSIERENPVQYYLSERQFPSSGMFLVIRTAGDPTQFSAQVRAAIRHVDPDLPIFRVTDMDAVVADSLKDTSLRQGWRSLPPYIDDIVREIPQLVRSRNAKKSSGLAPISRQTVLYKWARLQRKMRRVS